MKRLFLLLCILLVAASFRAETPLQVKTLRLSNGFTVWLNEDHAQPRVFGAVVVKAGAKDCPNTGIAHYFEHLLFKGTDRIGTVDYAAEKPWLDSISAQYDLLAGTTDPTARMKIQRHINELSVRAAEYAIPNEFESLISMYGGTGLNAYTSFDETVYHNSFAPQYLAQWCELNSERLIHPVFRLFQGELETVYEEKNMYADQMVVQAAEAAQREALAGTPYAYPIIGSTENLKNPRLSEMRKFYDQYYVAGNMGLILCGDIRTDDVVGLLERTFGRIRAGEAPRTAAASVGSWRGRRELRLKLPVPLVKARGYGFKAPSEHSADYLPFKVMMSMLFNDTQTGLLDSLTHENRIMEGMAGGYDFKDFSIFGFGFVPNLPFGSAKRADRLCWEQVDKLRRGAFSDDVLQAEKLSLARAQELDLETIGSRSKAMINAFSHGLQWDDVLAEREKIDKVTREDVARVARTYLNDDSLRVKKVFGHYAKERISQPGYRPVTPPNAGKRSAYAEQMARMPTVQTGPKFLDVERDASHRQLRPLVNLYQVKNPTNDIFSLQLIYRKGSRSDSRLEAMAGYLERIGTERHTKQQLGREMQRLGASLEFSVEPQQVMLTLTGFDSNWLPSVKLLGEFLTRPKADKRKYAELVKAVRLEEKTFLKDNTHVADAVYGMAESGDSSEYLMRWPARELKRMSAGQLVEVFKDLQRQQLDVVYSGRLAETEVAAAVSEYVPIGEVSRKWEYKPVSVRSYGSPVVYIYDNPKARQTIVGTYQTVSPLGTADQRARFMLWSNYFGGGMSSVLFQDIREFRAYAYYARGWGQMPDLLQAPAYPCAYFTRMGTQADKTMRALGVLDSLFGAMPLREANVAAAKQHMVNVVNNGYPSFRQVGWSVANCRLAGYTDDPARAVVGALGNLGMDEIVHFYEDEIQKCPRVTMIVGDKRKLDMAQIRKLGKVIELRAKDVYRR